MRPSAFFPALLLAAITVGTGTAFGGGATTQYKAFSFTMGAADYTLSEVILSLDSAAPMPTPVVEIWSDAGGTPGSPLFTLDNPAAPIAGPDDDSFTASTPFGKFDEAPVIPVSRCQAWKFQVSPPLTLAGPGSCGNAARSSVNGISTTRKTTGVRTLPGRIWARSVAFYKVLGK